MEISPVCSQGQVWESFWHGLCEADERRWDDAAGWQTQFDCLQGNLAVSLCSNHQNSLLADFPSSEKLQNVCVGWEILLNSMALEIPQLIGNVDNLSLKLETERMREVEKCLKSFLAVTVGLTFLSVVTTGWQQEDGRCQELFESSLHQNGDGGEGGSLREKPSGQLHPLQGQHQGQLPDCHRHLLHQAHPER